MEQFIGQALPYLIMLGVPVWIFYKLTTNPFKRCPRCKGSGNLPAGVWGRYRRCSRCGGKGEIRGWLGGKD